MTKIPSYNAVFCDECNNFCRSEYMAFRRKYDDRYPVCRTEGSYTKCECSYKCSLKPMNFEHYFDSASYDTYRNFLKFRSVVFYGNDNVRKRMSAELECLDEIYTFKDADMVKRLKEEEGKEIQRIQKQRERRFRKFW